MATRRRPKHQRPPPARLLTPAEVAQLFRVDPKTVTRWANTGKLASVRTLGGHRRYLEADILALLEAASFRAGSAGAAAAPGTLAGR